MKTFKVSIIAAALAFTLTGCNNDSSFKPAPEVPETPNPLPPEEIKPIIPSIPLEPANKAASNLVFFATSTYPRAALTGLVSSNANDGNDVFDLYYNTEVIEGDKPTQIGENVFYKGRVKMVAEKMVADQPTIDNSTSGGEELPAPPTDRPLQELEEISKLVMEVPAENEVNLFIEEGFIRRSTASMTPEALRRTKSISMVLEGSGSITDSDRLGNVIELAKQAEAHGVKDFIVYMFDSMDLKALAKRPQWAELMSNKFVQILPLSFEKLNREIGDGYETKIFGNMLKLMQYDLKTAFTKSANYDESKKLLVFFGSARSGYANNNENKKGGNYNNMLLVDKYLSDPEITAEYNVAVKPHPKLAWIVSDYIPQHQPDASYFSSIPFEMLVLAGGKDIDGAQIPVIDRVDSVYSTILFGVDKAKIHSVIDYSPYAGFVGYGDTVEFMRANYQLLNGWGFDGDTNSDGIKDQESYKELAEALKVQINAPHIVITNVEEYVNR